MGISSAMQTAVSGLLANSTAVGKISENIANANTTGYKRTFTQMVTTSSSGGASDSGVRAASTSTVSTSGTLASSTSDTDLAISGSGFFIVSTSPDETSEANYYLTRAGSFTVDDEGNLVNAAGYYLAGYAYDENGELGSLDSTGFSGLVTVNVSDAQTYAEASTAISVSGNLPSQETGVTDPSAAFVSSTDYYTALGATEELTFSWQPTSTDNQWVVTISDADGVTYGEVTVDFESSGSAAGSPLTYSNVVSYATAPAAFSFDTATGVATLSIDNGSTPQTIEVSLGAPGSFDGITQFAGDFTPQDFTVDGSAVSSLARTEIDEDGTVWGVFDNGERRALFMIPVATVTNPDGLSIADGNAYQVSSSSGKLSVGTAGSAGAGTIMSGTLESSNVEIAQELTDLIRVQRAYSSNATVVTTADDMLTETTQLKR